MEKPPEPQMPGKKPGLLELGLKHSMRGEKPGLLQAPSRSVPWQDKLAAHEKRGME